MNKPTIIALVGMPGSGKGTCTGALSNQHGWPVVHFGNMIYEEVRRRGLDNVADEKYVRHDMRKAEGAAVLAKHAAHRADELASAGHNVIVFDGLYSWSEYTYLHDTYGDRLLVIAIAAPRHLRHERVLSRQDSHRKYTSIAQIIDREVDEIESLEKGGPIAIADYTIVNDGDTQAMLAKLDQILTINRIISH